MPQRQNYFCVTGTYTGNGADGRNITGLGFNPELVIIKGGANAAVFRVKQVSGDKTLKLGASGAAAANQIQRLMKDGFQVGTDAAVNAAATVYYWVAFGSNGSQEYFKTGRYQGNGADDRKLLRPGLSFKPDILAIRGDTATDSIFRTSSFSGDDSGYFAGIANAANLIQALFKGGFEVGSNAGVNTNNGLEYFAAWKILEGVINVGTYSGDGASGRAITVGFKPGLFIVKQGNSTNQGRMVTKDSGANNTLRIGAAAAAAGEILSVTETGVTVSADASVNAAGSTYYWMAFKDGSFNMPITRKPTTTTEDLFVIGYYPKYRYSALAPANLPFSKLTHISHAFMVPTATGGLVNTAGEDVTAQAATLSAAAHAQNTKVLLSIGGAAGVTDVEWGGAVSDTYRATFIANIVSFINTYNYDGIDIDWEPLDTSSYETDLTNFIKELRAALGTTKVITMFISTSTAWKWSFANNVQSYMDRFVLSTYDFSYANALTVHDNPVYVSGSQPSYASAESAVKNFVGAGVARNKLVVGAIMYAQRWAGETLLHDVATINAFTAELYSALPGVSSTSEPTGAVYDKNARASYILGDPFTSFSSKQAIADKLTYVRQNDLGGLAFWELYHGYFSATTPNFPQLEPIPNRA